MTANRTLPEGAEAYSKTPLFTAATVPEKLKNTHNTKAGVWGQLSVNRGSVHYFIDGDNEPAAVVSAGQTFVILPEECHFVCPTDDAEFFVEFFK